MKKRTFRKGLLITLISIGIVLLSLNTIVSLILKNKINKTEIVSVKEISSNVFSGTISLSELELNNLMVDSTRVLNGKVGKVQIHHIKIFQYLSSKHLATGLIEISESQLTVSTTSDSLLIKKFLSNSKESKPFEGIIDSIVVKQSAIIFELDSGRVLKAWINNVNTGQIQFPVEQQSDNPILSSLALKTDSIVYRDSVSMYTFSIYNLIADKEDKKINFDLLNIHPHHDKNTFARRAKFQTDRFEGQVKNFSYNYLSFNSLLAGETFRGNASLDSFDLIVYRDKTIPRKENDIKHTVQKYLDLLKFDLDLDSLTLKNGEIAYQEKSEKSGEVGEINFGSLNCKLTGISNIRKDDTLFLKATSSFMNSASVQVDVEFPSGKNYFDCSGTVTGLPFKTLNKITSPAAGILFSRGNIKRLAFNMRADMDSSRGDLIIEYDDLDFAVQNKPGGDTTGVKSKIITFIAGDIFIPTSIPGEGKVLKSGIISNPRNSERFIFSYIWKSIFAGVKSAVLENMQEKKSKKRNNWFNGLFNG